MPAAEVPPPAHVAQAPSAGQRAALERRSGRLVLRMAGGLRADLGPAPKGRLKVRRGRFSARFTTPAGKRRVHRVTGRTLTAGRAQVLVTRDGVAFRLRGAEASFEAPSSSRAWMQRYTGAYERPYVGRSLAGSARGRYAFPVLLRHRGRYSLITESGVARDAVSHTRLTRRGLEVELARSQDAPRRTPWRVVVSGGLDRVVESDLPLALGRASRIRRTGWIEPGAAAWSWLGDRDSPRSFSEQKRFVRLAERMGWEYVTVDEGWRPAFVGALVRYARARGVKVVLWYDQDDVSARALDRAEGWGVAGIKADFFYSDSEANVRRMDDIARLAAARRMVVAFHGCTVPRGLQRTWPNVLTAEAVRGAEYKPPLPRNEVNLAFTRNPVGSMDFTPAGSGHRALAQSIVFESGLQHFGGGVTDYVGADRLFAEVPAAWDDTRLLLGEPDRHAVIARRSGRRWFVGGITAGGSPRLRVPLPAGTWEAHVVTARGARDTTVDGMLKVRGDFAAVLTPAS